MVITAHPRHDAHCRRPGFAIRCGCRCRGSAIEAMAGNANPGTVSAKMANTIDTSNALHAAYQPVDLAPVRSADAARRLGRKRIRENEKG
jgi:hypothetical protein